MKTEKEFSNEGGKSRLREGKQPDTAEQHPHTVLGAYDLGVQKGSQWLKTLSALEENLNVVSSTHPAVYSCLELQFPGV